MPAQNLVRKFGSDQHQLGVARFRSAPATKTLAGKACKNFWSKVRVKRNYLREKVFDVTQQHRLSVRVLRNRERVCVRAFSKTACVHSATDVNKAAPCVSDVYD